MNSQQLLQDAFKLFQCGQLNQAAPLFQRLIDQNPRDHRALHLLGVLRAQQGDQNQAIALISRALKIEPRDFGAHSNHGLALAASGRHREAVASYDQALSLRPDFYQAHYNRAVALAELAFFDDAVRGFDAALRLQPGDVASLYNRGLALASLGRLDEAVASYENALVRDAGFAPAWGNLGNALNSLGRSEQALACFDKAIAIAPNLFLNHYNRGTVLTAMQHHAEAVSSFSAALAIKPDDAAALGGKAAALRQVGEIGQSLSACEQMLASNPASIPALMTKALALCDATQYQLALAAFDALLAIEPDNAPAWNGRGAALHAMRRPSDALACFDRALELKPDFADALSNRALVGWMFEGRYDTAVADLTRSLAVAPDQPFVAGELLHLKMQGADWTGFGQDRTRLDAGIEVGKPVARPFIYQAVSQSPANLQKCSRLFASRCFPPHAEPVFERRQHGKIRLGYVSGEFKKQATAYLMAGLFEQHDRERFEVIALDNTGPDASPMRKRLEKGFDKVIDVFPLDDAAASNLIRAEEIDILINLNGYFGAPRMGLFARRSAPIQVNYLGFPGTLGAAYMDYIIADRIVIPDDEKQFYDEKVVWLPNCYQANDDKRSIVQAMPLRASAGLPEKAFVFCNFNQSYKLTPDIFASWMRILSNTPGSVLWLMDNGGPFAENLRRAAGAQGVNSDRLVFAPLIDLEEHLGRLACADLFLDTLPYNAHTTGSDALWAGVPLLTRMGTTFPGRVAGSMLHAMGLSELITQTPEQYETLAIQLARDPERMSVLRRKLATHRSNHSLFDTALFRGHIEAAYTRMWTRFEKGEPPISFAVPDLAD